MKKLKTLLGICIIILIVTSCEKEKGTVKFRNRSVTNKTYNIMWDGSVIVTLYPQQDSEEFEQSAGHHTLRFDFSNSGSSACSPSNPSIDENKLSTFTCSQ